jgi:uncharacterized membrane protein HdeD (DUF308 family)
VLATCLERPKRRRYAASRGQIEHYPPEYRRFVGRVVKKLSNNEVEFRRYERLYGRRFALDQCFNFRWPVTNKKIWQGCPPSVSNFLMVDSRTQADRNMAQQSTNPTTSAGLTDSIVAENRTWFTVLGIVLIILGIVAVAFPFMTTIVAKTFLGWLLLIGGVVQIMHAFSTQKWSAFLFDLIIGALYVIVGGWLAFFALAGIIALTALLAATFVVQGILECGMALRMRSQAGWISMLISGIIAIVAGLLIFTHLPTSAVWAVGLLVGINLISSGWAYLFLTLAAAKRV